MSGLWVQMFGRGVRPGYVSTVRAARASVTPYKLACNDRLMRSLGHAVAGICDCTEPFGPPQFRPASKAVLAYVLAKQRALKADYFRQRYGRNYWTGEPRHNTQRAARRDARWVHAA